MTDADKLAQVLAEHDCYRWRFYLGGPDDAIVCTCGTVIPEQDAGYAEDWHRTHVAAVVLAHLTAEGWGNLAPARIVLADREAELLEVKGPCSFKQCRLHHGHRGPCDTRRVTDWEPVETGGQE